MELEQRTSQFDGREKESRFIKNWLSLSAFSASINSKLKPDCIIVTTLKGRFERFENTRKNRGGRGPSPKSAYTS